MDEISEIDAIASIDKTLTQLSDLSARNRVLNWAWDKYSTVEKTAFVRQDIPINEKRTKKKELGKTKISPSIVKDLNLNTPGKTSFREFAEIKKPESNYEKCVVAVYFLKNVLDLSNITVNHVFTCFKNANWKIVDIYNSLAQTASKKGWIDTSSMENIIITTHGENLIDYDLPHKSK